MKPKTPAFLTGGMLAGKVRFPSMPVPGDKRKSVQLVGLGDVGGTLLTGLMLLGGGQIDRIGVYDPDVNRCRRYEQEMNQILPTTGERPRVTVLSADELFCDCDAFVFTASAGVPPVGSGVSDVRMAQYEKNAAIVGPYAARAATAGYGGLFFQVSDPVDQLCQVVSQAGLARERVVGCGLGVMLARADYMARRHGVTDFLTHGRVFGPHGKGLIVANAVDEAYDDALSRTLTDEVLAANLAVRETGYKPYIAPGLSSGAISILRALSGEWFEGVAYEDGVFFGSRMRLGGNGAEREQAALHPLLAARIQQTKELLQAWKRS